MGNTMKFVRQLLSVLLIAVFAATPAFAFNAAKVKVKQHAAMHIIAMVERDSDGKIINGGLCTAYAVGPHTLLTAEHCNVPNTNAIYLDDAVNRDEIRAGRGISYSITDREFDHQDHMLIDISGVNFKGTIELTDHVRKPLQGEHTYQWGNPGGKRDQYREGYVMGKIVLPKEESAEIDATGDIYLIAEPVIGGDSGSAIFSAVDGQLIGVLTYGIDEGQVAGMYAIEFTQAQIDLAKRNNLPPQAVAAPQAPVAPTGMIP